MFEPFGDHTQRQGLYFGDGFVPVAAVAHYARQRRHFGKPSAVGLPFDLDGVRHTVELYYLRPAQFH
jgi:hypothetical protein